VIAVITLLLAFPLGYRMGSRLAANTAYAVAYLWAFVFQTLYLLLDSLQATTTSDAAFEPSDFPWAYGVVTLSVFGSGFGLVEAGHRLAARRGPRTVQATAG
jgi:hypothetical protein